MKAVFVSKVVRIFTFSVLTSVATIVGGAQADVNVRCDVSDLASAKACMSQVSKKIQRANSPNEILASRNKDVLEKVLGSLLGGKAPKIISALDKASFVGVVAQHDDEMHLHYFSIPMGKAVLVNSLKDVNTVDLEFDLIEGSDVEALDFFFGEKSSESLEAFTELKTKLDAAKDSQN